MRLRGLLLARHDIGRGMNLRANRGAIQSPAYNYKGIKEPTGLNAGARRQADYDRLFARYMASTPGTAEARELLAELRRTPPC